MTDHRTLSTALAVSAARRLVDARASGRLPERLPLEERPRNHHDSAAITRATLDLLGAAIIGWKIGHSPKGPTFGPILSTLLVADGAAITPVPAPVIGLEGEIAALLDENPAGWPLERVADCIATLHPAIELVGPRFADVRGISALEAEADLGINAGAVVGLGYAFNPALLQAGRVSIQLDGQTMFESDQAGERMPPADALLWLANMLCEVGLPLEAGHYVLLGARTGMVSAGRCRRVEVRIAPLGLVSCSLSHDPPMFPRTE